MPEVVSVIKQQANVIVNHLMRGTDVNSFRPVLTWKKLVLSATMLVCVIQVLVSAAVSFHIMVNFAPKFTIASKNMAAARTEEFVICLQVDASALIQPQVVNYVN